jgi:hypothetical protein
MKIFAVREESSETPAGLHRRPILARLARLADSPLTRALRVGHASAPTTLLVEQGKLKR